MLLKGEDLQEESLDYLQSYLKGNYIKKNTIYQKE